MSKQTGFTLVELMIVLAVAAVLAGVALPAFDSMIKNNRRVTAVNDFITSVHIARSEAITRNRRVTLCPSTNGSTCAVNPVGWQSGWLVFTDFGDVGQVNPAAGDEILYVGDPLRGGLRLVSEAFAGYLSYAPNGRPSGSNENSGTMILCDADAETAARAIIITMTGRPRVDLDTEASCAS